MTDVTCIIAPATVDPAEFGVRIDKAKAGETLPFLQHNVGGYVDCIDIHHPVTGAIATVWFHDSGKIDGLPPNNFAGLVASIGGWEGARFGDWIAGPVVFTGFNPETGDTVTLPDEWVASLTTLGDTYAVVIARRAAEQN